MRVGIPDLALGRTASIRRFVHVHIHGEARQSARKTVFSGSGFFIPRR